jgi:hypothetical protein
MQQPTDMIDVIVDAEASSHQLGHPRTRPQIGVKAGCLRALEQQRFQPALVRSGELGRPSRRRLRPYAGFTASSRRCLPTPHAASIHSDASRNLRGQQSFLQQRQRAQAPSLEFLWTSGRSHVHLPTGMIGHYLSRNQ